MPTPFDVLGIDPDADEATVERAYRERILEAHPDHGGSVEEFQLVKAAYDQVVEGDWIEGEEVETVEQSDVRRQPEGYSVEYLNYEVVDDYGWSLDDEDLFERADAAGLTRSDYGRVFVEPGESLLEAAEGRGLRWPYSCRGGACANCAVKVIEGDLTTPVNHILPDELVERGFRLSCLGEPTVDGTKVVFNVKHLPELDDLRLPPGPFGSD